MIDNQIWLNQPNIGFLTPTGLLSDDSSRTIFVYGGVRDSNGRACIRSVSVSDDISVNPTLGICFDRRGSGDFDTDGTILGHIYRCDSVVRMLYVGFRKVAYAKFMAWAGLAESHDQGLTFHFQRRILTNLPTSIFGNRIIDIAACHWADLDDGGNGKALIAVGDGWLSVGGKTLPKYTSYFVNLENYEVANLICKIPKKDEIYRLGRPRFLLGKEYELAVLTGGMENGDYRPYFYQLAGDEFLLRDDLEFPVKPGAHANCMIQVSYPEVIRFSPNHEFFLFNGDKMGEKGCLSIQFSL